MAPTTPPPPPSLIRCESKGKRGRRTKREKTSDQQVETRDDVARKLHKLTEIAQLPATVVLFHEEHLQVTHLVEDGHVCKHKMVRFLSFL